MHHPQPHCVHIHCSVSKVLFDFSICFALTFQDRACCRSCTHSPLAVIFNVSGSYRPPPSLPPSFLPSFLPSLFLFLSPFLSSFSFIPYSFILKCLFLSFLGDACKVYGGVQPEGKSVLVMASTKDRSFFSCLQQVLWLTSVWLVCDK